MAEVRERMAEGADRLSAAGLDVRDASARLDLKEDRGTNTTVERRILNEPDGSR